MRYAKNFLSLDEKEPNIFFKAKQEIKKPKSSYVAAKKPSYQPWYVLLPTDEMSNTIRGAHVKNL